MKDNYCQKQTHAELDYQDNDIHYMGETELKEFIVRSVLEIKKKYGKLPKMYLQFEEIQDAIKNKDISIDFLDK